MLKNNNLLVGIEREEDQKERVSLDELMAQMVNAIAEQFMEEVKEEILSMKRSELLAERDAASSGEFMTRKDVMKLLKRCDSTLTKWARKGYLVPLFIGGKYLYRKSDVMKLMK